MEQKPVVVTTKYRGVFFGYLSDRDGNRVVIAKARNCLCWSRQTRGFIGLSTDGPNSECRIGPASPSLELFGVTSISDVTPQAVQKWEAAPWS